MSAWIRCGGIIFLFGTLFGCGHDPNHGISRKQAEEAARRVHPPPPPMKPDERAKIEQDHGG